MTTRLRGGPRKASALTLLALAMAACGSQPPAPPLSGATRVIVVGDFGTGDEDEYVMAEAIRNEHEDLAIDGLITTGDNIYPDGGAEYFDSAWHQPYGWTQEEGVRIVASLGNHDVEQHAAAVMRLLGMQSRWYQTSIGPLQIIVLDSTKVANAHQQAFLQRKLTASPPPGKYRIVVFHHLPFSCSFHKNTDTVLETWRPLITAGQVDLVLSGHDHVYERFEPVSGTTHVVTGGGGYSLHDVGDCPAGTPELIAESESYHYVLIEATDEQVRVQAIDADDRQLDIVTIR